MSKKVKIKLNMPGINAVMKSDGVKSLLKAAGDQVATIAGDGYTTEEARDLNWISIVNVYPETKEAGHDNFKNNTLLKALSASGLKMTKRGKK